MKCPNCDHVSETALLKCSACGEAYDRHALETLRHLEYLLAWLDQRADTLGLESLAQLRGEVLTQLDATRDVLGLASMPSPDDVAFELILVRATYQEIQVWGGARESFRVSMVHLCQHLSIRTGDLKKYLAGRPAEVEPPSHLQVLDFALESLPLWTEELSLPSTDVASLHRYLDRKRAALLQPIAHELALVEAIRQRLQGWVEAAGIDPGSAADLRRCFSSQVDGLEEELAGRSVKVEPPLDLQVLDFALESLLQGAEELHFSAADVAPLRRYLNEMRTAILEPTPSPEPIPVPSLSPLPAEGMEKGVPAAPPAPRPKPAPKAPPKPKRPPITWGTVWEKAVEAAVSGALLRGLLYLGAFMIVVSGAILVIRFWEIFPEVVQLIFIAAVPATFYLAGWGVRSKLKLPQAGGVLTGIGALLVAVDFAAVYQFGGLSDQVDGNAYWLGASLFCTGLYAVTAWRLPAEFFDYITLIAGSNMLPALTRLLNLPLEWTIASATASSLAMIGGAVYLKRAPDRWGDFALATRRLPQVLVPASLAVVLFVPGDAALGQMATFAFAALGYGLLAWRFPAGIFAHAAVWTSVGAAGLATLAFTLPGEWYALTAAALAIPYILGSWWLDGRLDEDFAPRRAYLGAIYLAGFGLVAAATLGGFVTLAFDLWAGVIALALAALVLAGGAYLFRRPVLVLLASGLFIAPFSLAVGRSMLDAQVMQWGAWLMVAWAGLALTYMGLAMLLRAVEKYGAWLNVWAHVLAPSAFLGLSANYGLTAHGWFAGPTLIALGGVILVYLASAAIHDSGRHPALSNHTTWLPGSIGRAIFLWPTGLLLPVWLMVFWSITGVGWSWLGAALAGFALAYVGLGQLLARRRGEYRLPAHVYAYVLAAVAIVVAWAWGDWWALLTTLYIVVGVLTALALVYRRVLETALAALLFIWPFQLSLELSPLTPHAHSLAYALLAGLGYLPLGLALDKVARKYARPVFVIEYGLSAYAVAASLLGRFRVYPLDVPWVGMVVPLIVTGLQALNVYRFKRSPFAWVAALTFAIAFGQTLTLLRVPPEYDAAAWVSLAFAYLLGERGLAQVGLRPSQEAKERAWFRAFRWPLGVGSVALCVLGLLLTADGTATAFVYGGKQLDLFPLILAQSLAVGLTVLAARLYRTHWPLYLEPGLAFFPVTLFFVGYGEAIFGQSLSTPQYGVVWSLLSLVHLLAGVLLDRSEARYAHGPYLGGYTLGAFAILWTLADSGTLVWTLGLGILAALGSALLVHFDRHHTWDELIGVLFGQEVEKRTSTLRTAVRGAFLWLVAWSFPAWCVLLLRQLNVIDEFTWLGCGLSALLFLGLAVWLRRVERTYAWPFHTAAQFYIALGLLISTPLTMRFFGGRYHLPHEALNALAFVLLQALAVAFYAASAWVFRRRFFAHLAAWLSFLPYTLAWIVYDPSFVQIVQARFAWIWTGWAAVLLTIGFLLDHAEVRYAHGPYLAGYVLAGFALAWSASNRLTNLYTLVADIVLALASHVLMHRGRHRSFDDFVRFFWHRPGTVAHRTARTVFLFFAAYAFPVWLAQLLTYYDVGLAWRGLALALVAPIYIAFGLAARQVRSEYTWPLYSAGYALTAIGAMVTYDDLALAIYVLTLDAVVYAVSAYIFRQSFWLYLSNVLVPAIALLILQYNELLSPSWVGGVLMGLAFLYFGIGRWFDRQKETRFLGKNLVSRFALPFYAPGYLLSAVALAVASSERTVALAVYSSGVVLYGLSAWAFRESVFLYPAAWLAAVPYYLGMTLTPLEPRWYGLGWLPLIVGYIGLGRFLFQKASLGIEGLRTFLAALTHPAMPFYLLAYGLSVSMMALSQPDPLAFTLALVAGAVVYFASSSLFRRRVWLYPGLLAAHLALMSYFTISPSRPVYTITLPFLGMTWAMALIGYGFSRQQAAASGQSPADGDRPARWPFLDALLTLSWAQPFFVFAALDLIFWQALALYSSETAIILATGNAVLLGLFAMLWLDVALTYTTLGFFLLAVGYRLGWAGVPFAGALAWIGGIGFGLYLVARIVERCATHFQIASRVLGVWPKPLTNASVFLTALAVVVTPFFVTTHTTATAAALAFAGALYLAIAYRGRYHRLGYLGMAMLQLAWALVLVVQDVKQPQWYAIPAGFYFTGVGYLERRRRGGLFPVIVESFGLAVLLVTSFIQSLNGAQGFPYFVLLIVEGLVVIGWGASRHLKAPFFIGLGASALNVVAQVVVLVVVHEARRWFIILGVGLAAVIVGMFVERKRELIVARAPEWREALETWE